MNAVNVQYFIQICVENCNTYEQHAMFCTLSELENVVQQLYFNFFEITCDG